MEGRGGRGGEEGGGVSARQLLAAAEQGMHLLLNIRCVLEGYLRVSVLHVCRSVPRNNYAKAEWRVGIASFSPPYACTWAGFLLMSVVWVCVCSACEYMYSIAS